MFELRFVSMMLAIVCAAFLKGKMVLRVSVVDNFMCDLGVCLGQNVGGCDVCALGCLCCCLYGVVCVGVVVC